MKTKVPKVTGDEICAVITLLYDHQAKREGYPPSFGMTVDEIATDLGTTPRRVTKILSKLPRGFLHSSMRLSGMHYRLNDGIRPAHRRYHERWAWAEVPSTVKWMEDDELAEMDFERRLIEAHCKATELNEPQMVWVRPGPVE